MEFTHIPVLLNETINGLNIRSDGIYVDGTVGGAGHSQKIASMLDSGRLIAFDRDPDAVEVAKKRLNGYRATVIKNNYSNMKESLREIGIDAVDGVLLDLGVSSFQIDNAERGFSFHNDAPLDMRMSKEGISAADIVNTYTVDELTSILHDYGEEKFAYRIAKNIDLERQKQPITTTKQLADIICRSVPAAARRDGHPARQSFQAIRIAVNAEFSEIEQGIESAFELLKSGGRICIITFHSLEDRIVKQKFASYCRGCICPPDLPVCVCGRVPKAKLICKKPIIASEEELKNNPRSRSAKLRVLEKI